MNLDNKLDLILEQLSKTNTDMSNIKSDMTNMKSDMTNMKSDMTNMKSDMTNMKSDMTNIKSDMSTKSDLRETENNILGEIDTVQEKSNARYKNVFEQLKLFNSTINAIKFENSTVNLLLKSVSDLQAEVETLKARLDKVS